MKPLSQAQPSTLKLRAMVKFPSMVEASSGIGLEKTSGKYIFGLHHTEFVETPTVPDQSTQKVVIVEPGLGGNPDNYQLISLANIGSGYSGSYQPLDPTLTALAALDATGGLLVETAQDTFAKRSVTAGYAITVTNGDGVAGNISVAVTDPELVALGGLTSAVDKLPYFTGSGTASLADFTATARSLLDDTSTSAMRTTLGVAIGSDVQAYDADLAALAALSSTGIARRTGTNAWSVGTGVANSELATATDGTIKSNISGSTAAPSDNSISAVLDKLFGTTQGSVVYRGSSAWAALTPGTSGQFLKTLGAAANPAWGSIPGGGDMLAANYASEYVGHEAAALANLGLPGILDAWTAYTPVPSAASGTLGSASATGSYKKIGTVVFFKAVITVTNIGTAAYPMGFTLPSNSTGNVIAVGRNTMSGSGNMVQGFMAGPGNVVNVYTYNNGSTLINGSQLVISGFYETAP